MRDMAYDMAREISELRAEIERLRAENAKYRGALRFLAGEGLTVAREALNDTKAEG